MSALATVAGKSFNGKFTAKIDFPRIPIGCFMLPLLIRAGANKEGFNFKLAMAKTCSTWPLLKNMPLEKKKIEVDFQTPPLPQTPYIAYGIGQKLKIGILFLQLSKCIPINLKWTPETFIGKFEGFYVPNMAH